MGYHGTKRGVMVYLPEELHRWLKAQAALSGCSLSALIEEAARHAYPEAPAETALLAAEERPPYGRAKADKPRR